MLLGYGGVRQISIDIGVSLEIKFSSFGMCSNRTRNSVENSSSIPAIGSFVAKLSSRLTNQPGTRVPTLEYPRIYVIAETQTQIRESRLCTYARKYTYELNYTRFTCTRTYTCLCNSGLRVEKHDL